MKTILIIGDAGLIGHYLTRLFVTKFPGYKNVWLDTGTFNRLIYATKYVRVVKRQGLKIGCSDEIALRRGFITKQDLATLAKKLFKRGYGIYLTKLLDTH